MISTSPWARSAGMVGPMPKPKPKKALIEVEPREVPEHEKVALRYPAPPGTRTFYRRAAKLEGFQHEVWIRETLWQAAKAVFEKHGVDTSDLPERHFPRPPRIQPRPVFENMPAPEDMPQAKRRAKHARYKQKRLEEAARTEQAKKAGAKKTKKR